MRRRNMHFKQQVYSTTKYNIQTLTSSVLLCFVKFQPYLYISYTYRNKILGKPLCLHV